MPAQIRPTRLDVTDRFPMLGFRIRDDARPSQAEVAIAADPSLFTPEGKANRTAANFWSSRGNGALRFQGEEASFTLPPEVLARFIGNDKLYYGLATGGEGGAMKVAVAPTPQSPYIKISGLSGRSMTRIRVLPNRQQRAAGYGHNGQAQLEWAGDAAQPGMTPLANGAAPNGASNGAANGAANGSGPVPYDDGFGPLPAPASEPAAPAVAAQGLGYPPVRALSDAPVPVSPPEVSTLGWVARQAAELVIGAAGGAVGPFLNLLISAANELGCSVGIGPQIGGGLGAGGALGAGIIFGRDNDLGVYGSAEIDIGFITSISATAVVTIVQGGIEAFSGWNYGFAISGGEGIVGGAMVLLNDRSEFVGVSANVGIGAGFSPVDFYFAAQRGWATRVQALAQAAFAQGLVAPARGRSNGKGRRGLNGSTALRARAMIIGPDDVTDAQRYAPEWLDLWGFRCPAAVESAIAARGMSIQRLADAAGDLNLDRYEVRIDSFPAGWDGASLVAELRTNMNGFISTGNTSFGPYDATDAAMLAAGTPLGAVLALDIIGPDNAAVVISEVTPQRWRVATLQAPDTGSHPVTGTREWGWRTDADGATIVYTRGCDRSTYGVGQFLAWYGANSLWESFQQGIANWANSNGGSATILPPFSQRFHAGVVSILFGPAAQSLGARAQAARSPGARALSGGQSFTINWDDVQQIAQPTDLSCWATAASMVIGWRDRQSVDIDFIARQAGQTTATGLQPEQVGQFAIDMGLTAEPPQSYTIEAFRDLLAANGPLWVGAAVPGLHVIVVTGMYHDGEATYVRITDPWDRAVGTPGAPGPYHPTSHTTGSRYIMRWEDFVAEYEAAAANKRVNLQILHTGGTHDHVANTGASTPPGYAMAASARKRMARGLSGQSYTLNWDEVELIPQPNEFTCWAAAGAMVIGWRDMVSLSPESVAQICGRSTASGLDPGDTNKFASEMGLVAEAPACYTEDGFRNLLERNGPLWVAADVPGLHAIVVTGIYNDGSNTFVRIADPWDRAVGSPGAPGSYATTHVTGSRYIMTYADFTQEYENAAGAFPGSGAQILHSGGTGLRQPNRGPSTPPGYAMSNPEAEQLPAGDVAPSDAELTLAPPPPPRARAMDAISTITTIGGLLPEIFSDSSGDISWDLDQFRGLKHPGDTAPANPAPFQDAAPIELNDWPKLTGWGVDDIYAWFKVDWQYNGKSLGNIRIVNTGTNDARLMKLKVRAQIMDDAILYEPGGIAALRVRFHYRFSRTPGDDIIAITELQLFADGTYLRDSKFHQLSTI
jgi:hypothetical protein